MYRRLASAALAALSIGLGAGVPSSAGAQSDRPDLPEPARHPEQPKLQPTPIKAFSDVSGRWQGMIDITTRVVLFIGPDGVMKFQGPNDITQQTSLVNDRLVLRSRNTELDCVLISEFLACNARFDNWFAQLSLRRP